MEYSRTEKTVRGIALPIAERHEVILYDVEYAKEGGNSFLRVFIDRDGGVDLDECEAFSRELSGALDKNDPIPGNYYLEVSSPGIERRVRRREHFELCRGETVDVGLYKAIDGRKKITGVLEGLDEQDCVVLIADGQEIKIPYKQTAVIRVHFDF